MRTFHRFLALAFLAVSGGLSSANAAVIWDQALPVFSTQNSSCSPCGAFWRGFGGFSLTSASELDGFRFFVYDYESTFGDVNVSIWSNDLSQSLFSKNFTSADYTKGLNFGNPRLFTVTLALDSWALDAGTYFVSAFGINGSSFGWGTDPNQNTGSDDFVSSSTNSPSKSQTAYFGFQLTGSPTTVPVPAAAWFLGAGFLGIARLARRRR